jgi:hypothetical protein
MARITHPNPQLGRTRPGVGGVVFRDGVAEVDLTDKPILHDFYVKHGYGIDYDIDELAANVNVNIPLSALTIKELLKVASDNAVDVPAEVARGRKAQLLEHIEGVLAHRKLVTEGSAIGELDGVDADELQEFAVVVAEQAEGEAPKSIEIQIDRSTYTLPPEAPVSPTELLKLAGREDGYELWLSTAGGRDIKLDDTPILIDDGTVFFTAPQHINGS